MQYMKKLKKKFGVGREIPQKKYQSFNGKGVVTAGEFLHFYLFDSVNGGLIKLITYWTVVGGNYTQKQGGIKYFTSQEPRFQIGDFLHNSVKSSNGKQTFVVTMKPISKV